MIEYPRFRVGLIDRVTHNVFALISQLIKLRVKTERDVRRRAKILRLNHINIRQPKHLVKTYTSIIKGYQFQPNNQSIKISNHTSNEDHSEKKHPKIFDEVYSSRVREYLRSVEPFQIEKRGEGSNEQFKIIRPHREGRNSRPRAGNKVDLL